MASGEPMIMLQNVKKTYEAQPDKPALDGVSLSINKGEFVFIVGHSGSGKSTFIRLLNREVTPDSGNLVIGGYDLVTMKESKVPYLRRKIGCVFQDFKLLPNKTVYENVAFAMECIGTGTGTIRRTVPEVLKLVGLEDKANKKPDELSGGEQQRVSIARALVNKPPMLICDEPTGNLDPGISQGIMELLMAINRGTGTTVIVATHDHEAVDKMRQRVIRLENGHVVADNERSTYNA